MIEKNNFKQKLSENLSKIEKMIGYEFTCLLLFYKAYSDKWEREFEEEKKKLIEIGWSEEEAIKEAASEYYHTFNFPQEYLWENIRRDPQGVVGKFSNAMKKLAELNPDYQDVFSQFDFSRFSDSDKQKNLAESVELLSEFSFKEISTNIIGEVYELILENYAPEKPKEGKLYTSRDIIRLMIKLLDPKPEKSIYDPAAGFGGMLISAYKYISSNYGNEEAKKIMLYGQELDDTIYVLGKLNLMLHNIENVDFRKGDSILFPKFKEENFIKKFDYVISNPPWNQKDYNTNDLKRGEHWRERFMYGLTTKKSADWAWIQHMLASAKEKVAVVIDTGAVSRGKREKLIRQKIIEDDLIESVVLIAEKVVSKKSTQAVIIVFNKNKATERKEKILLINASKEFKPERSKNILSEENIEKIVDVYRNFKEIKGLSRIITLEDVREADYNLSPSRFVSIAEEEEYRSIEEIKVELERLEEERRMVEEKIIKILEKF